MSTSKVEGVVIVEIIRGPALSVSASPKVCRSCAVECHSHEDFADENKGETPQSGLAAFIDRHSFVKPFP